jgi:hypothetical protein
VDAPGIRFEVQGAEKTEELMDGTGSVFAAAGRAFIAAV